MKYLPDIHTAQNNPEGLEQLYQAARKENATDEFKADMVACYEEAPENVLYAAWFYRLQQASEAHESEHRRVNWKLAVPLSILTALVLWLLSDDQKLAFRQFGSSLPYIALLWAPVVAALVIAFITLTARLGYRRSLLLIAGLAGAALYAMLLSPTRANYRELMIPHLPLLAWAGVGVGILGLRSSPQSKFAFLIKSIETVVTGGVYLIATYIFAGITFGMFEALNIQIPDLLTRLIFVGPAGLLPLIAVATAYDPTLPPAAQEFKRGVGRLIITFPRVLLGLSLIVLVIYIAAIPFNFMAPFENRDVLIIYNGMLFAVMALLVGATPVNADDLSGRYQNLLRTGIISVATLVVVVSLYALAATVYRTYLGGLTINRLTIIGWNSINIGLLVLLIYKQLKGGKAVWIDSLHATFHIGSFLYVAWALFLLLAAPWLF
jgi:hypothetical protein